MTVAVSADSSGSSFVAQLLDAARPALDDFLTRARGDFMARFGAWVKAADRGELEDIFLDAGVARLQMLMATTTAEAVEWADVYKTELLRLDTVGLELLVLGEAATRAFLRTEIHTILSYVPVVAGTIVRVALTVAVPGVGAVIGAPAGAGVEWVLGEFLGKPT